MELSEHRCANPAYSWFNPLHPELRKKQATTQAVSLYPQRCSHIKTQKPGGGAHDGEERKPQLGP